jgi:eukaryotic-like serine/threonine-protein kinase
MNQPPPDDDEPQPWKGPTLRADGSLDGAPKRRPAPPPPRPVEDAPLELQERPRRNQSDVVEEVVYREVAAPRPWGRRLLWLAGLLVGLGLGAALVLGGVDVPGLGDLSALLGQPTPAPRPKGRPRLFVTSEPSGATVLVGSTVLGETPLGTDNLYREPVTITLRLRGHKDSQHPILPGADARIEARLEPAQEPNKK